MQGEDLARSVDDAIHEGTERLSAVAGLMDGNVIYRREHGWSVFCLPLPAAPVGIRACEQEPSLAIII
ncbi:MAG TPA: hypothetical protein VF148_10680 [Acidimicrobiia bacterium]